MDEPALAPGMRPSADRIMIIDNDGACGKSKAGTSAVVDADGDAMSFLKYTTASPKFHPVAHDKTKKQGDQPPLSIIEDPYRADSVYHYNDRPGMYCPQSNIDVTDAAITVNMDGFQQPVSLHQCYSKCLVSSCTGSYCFCDGALSGFDGADSNAICGDVGLCKSLCDGIASCTGFDMAKDRSRCFLNTGCEAGKEADAKPDAGYTLYMKTTLDNEPPEAFLEERPTNLWSLQDLGASFEDMLRFEPVSFTSGGSFKLCFCDLVKIFACILFDKSNDFSYRTDE
jgi:hypothetical protein